MTNMNYKPYIGKMPLTIAEERSLKGYTFKDFKEDAIRISHSCSVVDCIIEDTLAISNKAIGAKAHRDAVQLIAPPKRVFQEARCTAFNQQYALAVLNDVALIGVDITSVGQLQGIFTSDGLYTDIQIFDCKIDTNSQHKITLNGLLSGVIDANIDAKGKLLPVVLNPARIGGGGSKQNVWIHSFKDQEYEDIRGESKITDNRKLMLRKNDIYLKNFDKQKFVQAMPEIQEHATDTMKYTKAMQQLALSMVGKNDQHIV